MGYKEKEALSRMSLVSLASSIKFKLISTENIQASIISQSAFRIFYHTTPIPPYPQHRMSYEIPRAHGAPAASTFSAAGVSAKSFDHIYHPDFTDVANSPPVHRLRSGNTDLAGSGAPIMNVVWWVCCGCDNMNNPILAPDRCSQCPHYKCSHCSAVNV
jgi:hypothetical protein